MDDTRLENEIAHGKYLKSLGATKIWNWDTPTGKIRMKRRVEMLSSQITRDMTVLEIGCGTGLYSKQLAKTRSKLISIDISPDLLDIAKENNLSDNITYKVENAYDLSFDDNSFDAVVGSSSLHHLNVEKTLKEFYRVLKPGGSIHFTEPNMLNPHIYLERMVPYIRKKLHVSPDESAFIRWKLKALLTANGFTDITIYPFDFLYPLTPKFMIPFIQKLSLGLEKIPLFKEIAGSVNIEAHKK